MKFSQSARAVSAALGLGLILAGCGGGGGGEPAVPSSVTNLVGPTNTVTLSAGQSVAVSSQATAHFDAMASQTWTATQVSGPTTALVPTVSDASCATASVVPGHANSGATPGRDGVSTCQTTVTMPAGMPTSQWALVSTAKSAGGGSDAGRVVVSVTAAPLAGFTLNLPVLPQLSTTGSTATLTASTTVNAGVTLDGAVGYQWTQLSGPAVAVAGASTAAMSFLPASAGTYVFQVQASVAISGVTQIVKGAAVAIVADAPQFTVGAGPAQVAAPNTVVTLTGSESGTVAASNLSYAWTQTAGPTTVLFNNTSLTPTFYPTVAGLYQFKLTATSNGSPALVQSALTGVSVVAPTNSTYFAPSAGAAQVAALNSVVKLNGSAATSTPAPALAYTWTQTSGPAVAIAAANTASASFIPTSSGVYGFQLSATDGTTTKTDATVVTVSPAPTTYFTVAAGSPQSVLANNTATLQGVVGGTSAPADLTYAWTQTAGPAPAALYNANSLTAQAVPATAGNYEFTLTVTQAGATPVVQSAKTLVVVSPAASTTPSFGVTAGNAQVVGPNPVSVTLQGTLVNGTPAPDAGSLAYQWVQTSGPAVTLANAGSLVASFVGEAVGVYTFQLTVTSGGVSHVSTTSVDVLSVKP